MKRIVYIASAAIVILAAVFSLAYYINRPTRLSGDPWDYNLTQSDLSEGWQAVNSNIETAHDLIREGKPETEGLKSVHSIQFTHAMAVDVFDITSQVLLFNTAEAAETALAGEVLGDEWEPVQISQTVGDQAMVWRLKPLEDAPQQASYRVAFRFLNGVASLGVTGTNDNMRDESTALSYAQKVLSKMQTGARPEALSTLGNRPDLRGLLLTQDDLAAIDSSHGDQWIYNSLLAPGWTPNSAFENPDGMIRLGRLVGYQAWLIKPLSEDDLTPEATTQLFQQVTIFQSPESAQAVLEKMAGLESGAWAATPNVGEAAKGWTQMYQANSTSAGSGAVAATEISFRVGAYTGSIRVQSSPVTQSNVALAQAANELLANQLALALAANLKNAGK